MRQRVKAPHKSTDGKPSAVIQVRGRRLWPFRVFTVILTPVLMLLLLEQVLRAGGYSFPAGVTIPCAADGVVGRGDDIRFGRHCLPPNIAQDSRP